MDDAHRRRALAAAIAIVLASGAVEARGEGDAGGAATDDTNDTNAAPPTLRVEVTGSHITRADTEDALPVQVITREDIERSGVTTVAELASRIAANVMAFNDQLSIGNQLFTPSRPGQSTIDLRGLGDGNTLVLINGRRVANYAFDGSSVDVNSIPVAAIDRVEVLKDGASAIYGTDAIAGVVNFILRTDFEGFAASAGGNWTEQGGGDQANVAVTAGYGNLGRDRFNVFATFVAQRDQALSAAQRSFAKTGYTPQGFYSLRPETFPANIDTPEGSLVNPAYAMGCVPPTSIPATVYGIATCWYDPGSLADIIPKVDRQQALARATFALTRDWKAFAEAAWSANALRLSIAPTPAWQPDLVGQPPLLYPAGGPYYPADFAAANGLAGDLSLAYRTIALGNRVDDVDTSAVRAVVGVDGTHGDWDLGAAIVYSANRQTDHLASGFVSQQRLIDAMATGLVNPFGASGPAGNALLAATEVDGDFHDAHGTTWLAEAHASGEVARLPAGPLTTAFGGEWRRESLVNDFSSIATSGDVIGTGGVNLPSTSGDRDAFAVYAEAEVPITARLESQLALRYDHYSDFGGTTNPKVALRWQPAEALLLRASWGTGFRAPALYDLYTPAQHGFTRSDAGDPLRCPATGLPSDCLGGFPAVYGGNPDLRPETSEQVNGGIVWDVARGLSLSADYWRIRKSNVIAPLPEDQVLAAGSPWAASNIVRGPVDPRYPDLPGPIESVILVNENIGQLLTSGVDVGVHWQGPPGRFGRLAFALDGTWIAKYTQTGADGITQSLAGNNDGPGTVPRWRHYASLDWSLGAWSATLAQTFQSSYSEIDIRYCDDFGCPVRRTVGTYESWDVQLRTRAGHATIAAGIKNLFDRAPPFALPSGYAGWYDATYADPRGRTYYATLSVDFR